MAQGGTTQEMGTFLTSAGLFNVTSQTSMANGTRVDNTAVNDSVGRNVAFFGVTNDAARFSLDPPSASIAYVFTDLAANQAGHRPQDVLTGGAASNGGASTPSGEARSLTHPASRAIR